MVPAVTSPSPGHLWLVQREDASRQDRSLLGTRATQDESWTAIVRAWRKRRGRVYSTEPSCAVRPKALNNGIRSSCFERKQRNASHMNRSNTAGADASTFTASISVENGVVHDLAIELVAQHNHVLKPAGFRSYHPSARGIRAEEDGCAEDTLKRSD